MNRHLTTTMTIRSAQIPVMQSAGMPEIIRQRQSLWRHGVPSVPSLRSGLPSETAVAHMPSTTTNILALPLAAAVMETNNNEDWVDTIQWLVPDGSGIQANYPQLDLRGMEFQMEIRRITAEAEVIIEASTWEGTLGIGAPPNYGFLIIYVPLASVMQYKQAGEYVGDIIAIDPTAPFTRVCLQIDLTITQGVTR